MSNVTQVFVEIGRDHSGSSEVDLARFRGMVESLLNRAYPSARVFVMFNHLLQDARIELGVGGDDGHIRIVRQLIDRASRKSRRRTRW
jgi:hypothetical protein